MKKIDSLFERDLKGKITTTVTAGCEWVLAGDGVATRKWDGTCCLVKDGVLYKRSEWPADRPTPAAWQHWSFNPEQRSGHGWLPVSDDPSDWMHREAWAKKLDDRGNVFVDGTYELIGPKIGKNPEGVDSPVLVPHGRDMLPDSPRDRVSLETWLSQAGMEGIVWHHHDGRMCKIKAKDFGIKR